MSKLIHVRISVETNRSAPVGVFRPVVASSSRYVARIPGTAYVEPHRNGIGKLRVGWNRLARDAGGGYAF